MVHAESKKVKNILTFLLQIVDPWGKIIAECPKYKEGVPSNESVAVATISKDLIVKVRKEMPVFNHRRTDLYELSEVKISAPIGTEISTFMFAEKVIPTSTVFYTTKYSYAFTNIRCVVPGRKQQIKNSILFFAYIYFADVLVASIRPAKRLADLKPEEVSDLFQTAVEVQKVMENVQGAESSTICVQDGKFAGQTVPVGLLYLCFFFTA